MTKKVEITTRGKVVGIRGLYKDLSSGRFYVRWSHHGVDKQLTVVPKNQTFSGLSAAAEKGLRALKKQVICILSESSTSHESSVKEKILRSRTLLENEIKTRWAKKGCSEKHILRLLRSSEGMCICTSSKPADIRFFNEYNIEQAKKLVENESFSASKRAENHKSMMALFNELIMIDKHHGCNPALMVAKPKYSTGTRTHELTFEMSAMVYNEIINDNSISELTRAEVLLFLRICVETGQRPIDVHMFDPSELDNHCHYLFSSHKTGKYHRVSHLISPAVMKGIEKVISLRGKKIIEHRLTNKFMGDELYTSFWSFGVQYYEKIINKIAKRLFNGTVTLYNARHFFVSELFRMTSSDIWAEIFTHEAKTTNAKHYLHVNQSDADALMSSIHQAFEHEITNQSRKTHEQLPSEQHSSQDIESQC